MGRVTQKMKGQKTIGTNDRRIQRHIWHHRLDIGININFEVQQTPTDRSPVYTHNLPVPINLKEDPKVEVALMPRSGKTLPFIKYASPIFAQRKSNDKVRLLVDL